MMTDKLLIDRGYKQYPPTAVDSDIVVACFQKRFDDEHGKKGYIKFSVVKSVETNNSNLVFL